MALSVSNGPGFGPQFPREECTVMNRCGATALVIGDIVMFDEANQDTGNLYVSYVPGNILSTYSNAILPATRGIGSLSGAATPNAGFTFGVVTDLMSDAGADNTAVRICIKGLVKCKLTATAATAGVPLVAANGVTTLTATYAVGNKIIGKCYEPNGSVAGLYMTNFDGVTGWGQMEVS